jgi:hypothetical protein
MLVARLLGEEKRLLVDYWLARLKDLPVSAEKPLKDRLIVRDDGRLALDLGHTKVTDLAPLVGMPLGSLNLAFCDQISDFSHLKELHLLTSLDLAFTKIENLAPLAGLPLEFLNLSGTSAFDLSPLQKMKLKSLDLRETRVFDLLPLTGMPLTYFDGTAIPAKDYTRLPAHRWRRVSFKTRRCAISRFCGIRP